MVLTSFLLLFSLQVEELQARPPAYIDCQSQPASHWLQALENSGGTDYHAAWCLFHLDERGDSAVSLLLKGLAGEDDYAAHHCDVILDAWEVEHDSVPLLVPDDSARDSTQAKSFGFGPEAHYDPPGGAFPPAVPALDASLDECQALFLDSDDPFERAKAAVALVIDGAMIDEITARLLIRAEERYGDWRRTPSSFRPPRDSHGFVLAGAGEVNVRAAKREDAEFHALRWLLNYLGERPWQGLKRAVEISGIQEGAFRASASRFFGFQFSLHAEDFEKRPGWSSILPLESSLEELQRWISVEAYSKFAVLSEFGPDTKEHEALGKELAKMLGAPHSGSEVGECFLIAAARVPVQCDDLIDLAIQHCLDYPGNPHSEPASVYLREVELSRAQKAALVPYARRGESIDLSDEWPFWLFAEPEPVFLEKVADLRWLSLHGVGPNEEVPDPGDFRAVQTLLAITNRLTGWAESYLIAALDRAPAHFRMGALGITLQRDLDSPALRAAVGACAERDPTPSVRVLAEKVRTGWE